MGIQLKNKHKADEPAEILPVSGLRYFPAKGNVLGVFGFGV